MHLLALVPLLASLIASGPEPPNSNCGCICLGGERLPPSWSFQPAHATSGMVGVCVRREGRESGGEGRGEGEMGGEGRGEGEMGGEGEGREGREVCHVCYGGWVGGE